MSGGATAGGGGSGKKVILVVEDDEATRRLIVETLGNLYDVREAKDGLEASFLLAEVTPDLVLCDVAMPKVDGFSLVRMMRHDDRLATTRVVFLTARTGVADLAEGIKVGARDYITKPFHVADLLAKVRKFLG